MPARTAARPAPFRLLAAAFGALTLAHLALPALLARPAVGGALAELRGASGGWVEPRLAPSLALLGAFLLVVALLGRRPPREFGWRAAHVLPGTLVTLGAWVAVQCGLALLVLARGAPLVLDPAWSERGAVAVLAAVLAQALGPALAEDTAFRGFFLPQIRLRLASPCTLAFLAAAGAVAGSALLLGLAHLPAHVLAGISTPEGLAGVLRDQASVVGSGLALGLVALATRNLFVVVGLHALLIEPAPLVAAAPELAHRAVPCVLGLVVVLALAHRAGRARAARRGARAGPRSSAAERRAA